jgi:hypothetical protein
MFKQFVFLVILVLKSHLLFAQQNPHDTTIRCVGFSFSYAPQFPGGDLAKRFGNNSNAGIGFWGKTRQNIVLGFQWNFLFSENVKEKGILDSIATSNGSVINKEGKFSDVQLFERGFSLHFTAGKVFSRRLGYNPNCGLFLQGGIGFIRHRIRVNDYGNLTPPLAGDYRKGYDRLTGGLMLQEFAGYWFMSNNRHINWYAGFECTQGITKSLRTWDYDLMRADTQQRLDLLWGFRAGWMIPIYKRSSAGRYYY